MTKQYKVWVHLEEIKTYSNGYEKETSMDDEFLPVLAGTFDDCDKAVEFMQSLDTMPAEEGDKYRGL